MTTPAPTNGYKIFGKGWWCRHKQYDPSKIAKQQAPPVLCYSGFHFCPEAVECLKFYELDPDNCYAEVEALGEVMWDSIKAATNELRIVKVLTYAEFVDLVFDGRDEFILTYPSPSGERSTAVFWRLSDGRVSCKSTVSCSADTFVRVHTYIDNKMDGEQYHYVCGRLESMETYSAGKQNGVARTYGTRGQLTHERHFKDGLHHGTEVRYFADGGICMKQHWHLGLKSGKRYEYHANGRVREKSFWRHGARHGKTLIYNSDGKLMRRREWRLGTLLSDQILFD